MFYYQRTTNLLRALMIELLTESLVFKEGHKGLCQNLEGESKDHGSDEIPLNYRVALCFQLILLMQVHPCSNTEFLSFL